MSSLVPSADRLEGVLASEGTVQFVEGLAGGSGIDVHAAEVAKVDEELAVLERDARVGITDEPRVRRRGRSSGAMSAVTRGLGGGLRGPVLEAGVVGVPPDRVARDGRCLRSSNRSDHVQAERCCDGEDGQDEQCDELPLVNWRAPFCAVVGMCIDTDLVRREHYTIYVNIVNIFSLFASFLCER